MLNKEISEIELDSDSDSDDDLSLLMATAERNRRFVKQIPEDSFYEECKKACEDSESVYRKLNILDKRAEHSEDCHDNLKVLGTFAKDLIENIGEENCSVMRNCLNDRMIIIKDVKIGANSKEYNDFIKRLSKLLFYGCKIPVFIDPVVKDKSRLIATAKNIIFFNSKRYFIEPYLVDGGDPVKVKKNVLGLFDVALKEELPRFFPDGEKASMNPSLN